MTIERSRTETASSAARAGEGRTPVLGAWSALAHALPRPRELVTPAAVGASVSGAGVCASMIDPQWAAVTPGGMGLGAAVAAGLLGQRRSGERAQVLQVVRRGLGGLIGQGETARVSARGWRGGWVGVPRRLRIRYDPIVAACQAKDWQTSIVKGLRARLSRDYQVVAHDPRRCLLVLRVLPVGLTPEDAPDPRVARRAVDVVEHLFGEGARVEDSWRDRELTRFEVTHRRGMTFAPNHAARLKAEKAINAMLPGRWRAHWDLIGDVVCFERRAELPQLVAYPVDRVRQERCLAFGVDEDGHENVWDLRNSAGTPQFITTGTTGSGKTVQMRNLVVSGARMEPMPARFRVCDIKRVEFVGLRTWPNVETFADTVETIVASIHQTFLEMERRYDLIVQGCADEDSFEDLILLIDEYRYTHSRINAWWAGVKPARAPRVCPIFEEVFMIASLGRTCRVRVVLGTQRPDADWLGGDVRDQFSGRASMGRLSPDGAKMMWESYAVGTSVPRGLPGRGTTVGLDGRAVEFQAYWVPDPRKATSAEDVALLEALRPPTVTYPRRVFLPPAQDDLDGEVTPLTYEDYINAPLELASEHPQADVIAPVRLSGAGPAGDDSSGGGDPVSAGKALQVVEEEGEVRYLDEACVRAGDLVDAEGSLLLVDAAIGLWGVIESAEVDALAEGNVCVCWRADQDGRTEGIDSFPVGAVVTVRTPIEEGQD